MLHDAQEIDQQQSGKLDAAEDLLPLVYQELRKLAAARLAHERPGQTLQATALVNEVYLRLAANGQSTPQWNGPGHFFAAASLAMRRILVENARRKQGPQAGGGLGRVELTEVPAALASWQPDLVALNEALDRLAVQDPRAAQVVNLRFFGGLTRQQTANALGVSLATADNDWAYAKGWLKAEMKKDSAR